MHCHCFMTALAVEELGCAMDRAASFEFITLLPSICENEVQAQRPEVSVIASRGRESFQDVPGGVAWFLSSVSGCCYSDCDNSTHRVDWECSSCNAAARHCSNLAH